MADEKNFTNRPLDSSPPERPDLDSHVDEKPPILGSWRNLYYVVIGFLVLQIIVYYFLTQHLQ